MLKGGIDENCNYNFYFSFVIIAFKFPLRNYVFWSKCGNSLLAQPVWYYDLEFYSDRERQSVKNLEWVLRIKKRMRNGTQFSPDFRISIQDEKDDGVSFLMHPMGMRNNVFRFRSKGNEIFPESEK